MRPPRIFIVLPILLAALSTGCGKPAVAVHASASPMISASPAASPSPSPTELPVGTLVNGWIAGIPDYVPRFPYGKLDADQSKIVEESTSTVFDLSYSGVQQADVDAYASTLKGKGYTVAAEMIGDTYTLTASLQLINGRVALVLTLKGGAATYALEAPV